ncbi:MAG: hypothetical protein PVH29_15115 [Candidatus Zixiibacteriota bacterium]|jgi:hypothetical protein
MAYEIYRTTAERFIETIQAVILKKGKSNSRYVAEYLGVDTEPAENALKMGVQLGFLTTERSNVYVVSSPFSNYLFAKKPEAKVAVLRLFVEKFEPYENFKTLLYLGKSPREAANRVKALYSMNASFDDIQDTLIDFGTYTNSLIYMGTGNYVVNEKADDLSANLSIAIVERESIESYVSEKLGLENLVRLNNDEVINPLINAYHALLNLENDTTAPVTHAANAVESYLNIFGQAVGTNVSNISGINGKAEELLRQNNLHRKHRNMLSYLGHVRNAADHGTDAAINAAWVISPNTAVEYVSVATSVIISLVKYLNQEYVL